jgi:hypothetical protein
MKKILLILMIGLLFQSRLHAFSGVWKEAKGPAGKPMATSSWYWGIGLGVDAPLQGWSPDIPLGGGGIFSVGYRLDPLLALQLDLNPWFFTGGGNSIYDYRAFCGLRFNFPNPDICPYFFVGPGYDVQVGNPNGQLSYAPAGVFGLGFQFDIHPGEHFFLESRYNILFYQGLTQQDVPVLFGMSEDL